jgi:hypothetical protein
VSSLTLHGFPAGPKGTGRELSHKTVQPLAG